MLPSPKTIQWPPRIKKTSQACQEIRDDIERINESLSFFKKFLKDTNLSLNARKNIFDKKMNYVRELKALKNELTLIEENLTLQIVELSNIYNSPVTI